MDFTENLIGLKSAGPNLRPVPTPIYPSPNALILSFVKLNQSSFLTQFIPRLALILILTLGMKKGKNLLLIISEES